MLEAVEWCLRWKLLKGLVAFGSGVCFGLVPEVEGVRDECGPLVVGEPLESGLGG